MLQGVSGATGNVEIDEERRRYIADAHARLPTMTYYEALGVAAGADKKTIKRAYFELVRTMHPDRYFGKNIGEYRGMLESIFTRITEAYEALTDRDRRAAYDAKLAAQAAEAGAQGLPRMSSGTIRAIDPKVAKERQKAMDALKERFAAAKSKANEHAAAGARARAAGDLSAALTAYKAALTSAPGDPAIVAAHAEVEREMAGKLVESNRKKAQMEERFGRWAEAAQSWRLVLEARPDDLEARSRLREALAKTSRS
jgi:curved DNA-binding protein CbpA